ncbi:MAG: YlmC/YmxH family sporulation protein [Clostridia bacterium]|nr:YlmC/YmxH family sporulation protein [Clostridia bacterium]
MVFSELREKEVINICDGKRYGHPIDIELNDQACAVALVVPAQTGWKGMLRSVREGIVIPWSHVRRIGDDVILVELDTNFFQTC